MTTGQRLVQLSGLSGVTAGQHLLAIRLAGLTTGAMLASRSGLGTGSAMAHLLAQGTPIEESGLYRTTGFIVNMGSMMNRL